MKSKKSFQWRLAQWLEIRWWKRYLSNKEVQPYLDQKRIYWQKIINSLGLRFDHNSKILDAGCGPAGIFILFEDQEIVAIDPLLDAYKELPHFNQKDYPKVTFKSVPIESFDSPDSFDWVCCLNAINHVEDWDKGLDILSGVVKTDGQLLLGIDVHNRSWLKWIFRQFPGDLLHPHQHDRQDYLEALRQRGWIIKKEYTWKKGFIFDYWLLVAQLKGVR